MSGCNKTITCGRQAEVLGCLTRIFRQIAPLTVMAKKSLLKMQFAVSVDRSSKLGPLAPSSLTPTLMELVAIQAGWQTTPARPPTDSRRERAQTNRCASFAPNASIPPEYPSLPKKCALHYAGIGCCITKFEPVLVFLATCKGILMKLGALSAAPNITAPAIASGKDARQRTQPSSLSCLPQTRRQRDYAITIPRPAACAARPGFLKIVCK